MKKIISKEYNNVYNYKTFFIDFLSNLKTKHDIDISNITYATSSCSDELNREADSLSILGNNFTLGGLSGFPHTGITGMTAFSHHISENGTAFIFYSAHIGITDTGELGKVLRPNQPDVSNSCGALMLALSRFQKDKNYSPNLDNHQDFQQMYLEQKLSKYKDRFLDAKNPIKEITEVSYEITEKEIYDLVEKCKGEFHIKKIVLLGGIIINTSPYFDDYLDIRKEEVIDL